MPIYYPCLKKCFLTMFFLCRPDPLVCEWRFKRWRWPSGGHSWWKPTTQQPGRHPHLRYRNRWMQYIAIVVVVFINSIFDAWLYHCIMLSTELMLIFVVHSMVAYFYHHLSDDNVDFSDHYVDLSEKHHYN